MKCLTSLTRYAVLRKAVPYAVAATIGVAACANISSRSLDVLVSKLSSMNSPDAEQEIPRSFYSHDSCNEVRESSPDEKYAETCSTHLMDRLEDEMHPQVKERYLKYTDGKRDAKRIAKKIKRSERYDFFLRGAAETYNIPVALLRAQMIHESNMDEDAKSPVGARGLMQIMPRTARGIHPGCLKHITDPATSIYCGARYLGDMMEQFNGNETMALAAYNWGPHRVKRGLRRLGIDPNSCSEEYEQFHMLDYPTLPKETRQYIQRIMATKRIINDRRSDGIEDNKSQKHRQLYACNKKR